MINKEINEIIRDTIIASINRKTVDLKDVAAYFSKQPTAAREEAMLHLAICKFKNDLVKFLLLNGAHTEKKFESKTALHTAAIVGNDFAVNALLDHGADIEARDENGDTPLFVAIKNGNLDIAAILLKRGAEVELDKK